MKVRRRNVSLSQSSGFILCETRQALPLWNTDWITQHGKLGEDLSEDPPSPCTAPNQSAWGTGPGWAGCADVKPLPMWTCPCVPQKCSYNVATGGQLVAWHARGVAIIHVLTATLPLTTMEGTFSAERFGGWGGFTCINKFRLYTRKKHIQHSFIFSL